MASPGKKKRRWPLTAAAASSSSAWSASGLSLLALVPVVLGIPYVVICILDVYMVVIGRVPPGEPMGMDTLAYPVNEALIEGGIGRQLIDEVRGVGRIERILVLQFVDKKTHEVA